MIKKISFFTLLIGQIITPLHSFTVLPIATVGKGLKAYCEILNREESSTILGSHIAQNVHPMASASASQLTNAYESYLIVRIIIENAGPETYYLKKDKYIPQLKKYLSDTTMTELLEMINQPKRALSTNNKLLFLLAFFIGGTYAIQKTFQSYDRWIFHTHRQAFFVGEPKTHHAFHKQSSLDFLYASWCIFSAFTIASTMKVLYDMAALSQKERLLAKMMPYKVDMKTNATQEVVTTNYFELPPYTKFGQYLFLKLNDRADRYQICENSLTLIAKKVAVNRDLD